MLIRYLKLATIFTVLIPSVVIADWKFDPHIYSRGGVTLKDDFSKRASGQDSFNLGSWGDNTNAIPQSALTEATINVGNGKDVRYTYGVDVSSNERYVTDDSKSLEERLNFIEFYKSSYSLWFGHRAYRGDGDFLTRGFPFDDHNMFGGGVRLEKVGPLNIEFAYGIKDKADDTQTTYTINGSNVDVNTTTSNDYPYINLFINKLEYPLSNGKIKTNLEVHNVKESGVVDKNKAYIAGVQFQRWGDKVFGGNLYNIALINYSKGYIYGGGMQSAYSNIGDSQTKKEAKKLVLKWGGDFKTTKFGTFYNIKYQKHMGKESDQKWTTLDFHLRPMYVLTSNVTSGLDLLYRDILDEDIRGDYSGWGAAVWGTTRCALMLAYNQEGKSFDTPAISLFVGRVFKKRHTSFFPGDNDEKKENFVRLNYEISI